MKKEIRAKEADALLYAMSDIHGFYDEFNRNLEMLGELNSILGQEGSGKLILLGDYIDGGPDSFNVLDSIHNLQMQYPKSVIVLRGNHEEWFIDFLEGREETWLGADRNLKTSRTFLHADQIETLKELAVSGSVTRVYDFVRRCINENHKELVKWLKKLPYFYETETQIFVHAGVDEEAGDYWKLGTPNGFFVSEFPLTTGKFYKDIICGHIGSGVICGNCNFHDIYFDGESHYFIDGTTVKSRNIPILAYDEAAGRYFSIKKGEQGCEWCAV